MADCRAAPRETSGGITAKTDHGPHENDTAMIPRIGTDMVAIATETGPGHPAIDAVLDRLGPRRAGTGVDLP